MSRITVNCLSRSQAQVTTRGVRWGYLVIREMRACPYYMSRNMCGISEARFGLRSVGVSIPRSIIGLRKAFNLLKSPSEFEPSTVGWQLCSQLASRLLPQGKY